MKIMPQVGILNSYQEYQKALLAKQFVDEMNRREINLGVESTIEVIAKNPKEYGLPAGVTKEAIKDLLSTLTKISGSKNYKCSYAEIDASKRQFKQMRDASKKDSAKYLNGAYAEAKKENKRLRGAIARDRAKNFFGFLGRFGITGAMVAVPTVLALTLLGGPLAIGIAVGSAIVGLLQHGIVRGLFSGIKERRNQRIRMNKRLLQAPANSFGSDKQLAQEAQRYNEISAEYEAMLADEKAYEQRVDKAIESGLDAQVENSPQESAAATAAEAPVVTETMSLEERRERANRYVLEGGDVSKMSEEDKLLVPAETWNLYVIDGKDPTLIPAERAEELARIRAREEGAPKVEKGEPEVVGEERALEDTPVVETPKEGPKAEEVHEEETTLHRVLRESTNPLMENLNEAFKDLGNKSKYWQGHGALEISRRAKFEGYVPPKDETSLQTNPEINEEMYAVVMKGTQNELSKIEQELKDKHPGEEITDDMIADEYYEQVVSKRSRLKDVTKEECRVFCKSVRTIDFTKENPELPDHSDPKSLAGRIFENNCNLNDDLTQAQNALPCRKAHETERLDKGDNRIYINGANGRSKVEFAKLYVQKCMERGIPVTMKLMEHSGEFLDTTILYVTDEDLEAVAEILDEIEKEHPELVDSFGTPIAGGMHHNRENGKPYYALCKDMGNAATYNHYVNRMMSNCFARTAAEYAFEHKEIYNNLSPEDKALVDKIRNSENYGMSVRNGKYVPQGGLYPSFLTDEQIAAMTSDPKYQERFEGHVKTYASITNFGDDKHKDAPIALNDRTYEVNHLNPEEFTEEARARAREEARARVEAEARAREEGAPKVEKGEPEVVDVEPIATPINAENEHPEAEEVVNATPAEQPEEQEAQNDLVFDEQGQGHLFDDSEYVVDVPKRPRTRKSKSKVEGVSLFDENLNPILPEEEQETSQPESPEQQASDEMDYSQEKDVYATAESNAGQRVDLSEIEAEKAKMREAGELAEEPAPVITREESQQEESELEEGQLQRKAEDDEPSKK